MIDHPVLDRDRVAYPPLLASRAYIVYPVVYDLDYDPVAPVVALPGAYLATYIDLLAIPDQEPVG